MASKNLITNWKKTKSFHPNLPSYKNIKTGDVLWVTTKYHPDPNSKELMGYGPKAFNRYELLLWRGKNNNQVNIKSNIKLKSQALKYTKSYMKKY